MRKVRGLLLLLLLVNTLCWLSCAWFLSGSPVVSLPCAQVCLQIQVQLYTDLPRASKQSHLVCSVKSESKNYAYKCVCGSKSKIMHAHGGQAHNNCFVYLHPDMSALCSCLPIQYIHCFDPLN